MRYVTLLALLFVSTICFGYNWQQIINIDRNVNAAAYYVGDYTYYGAYGADNILYVDNNGLLASYEACLPVWDILVLDESTFLFVMGDGSYSDGLYLMNLATEDFEVVDWMYCPTFIEYCDNNGKYYCGGYSGLWESWDGAEWSRVEQFNQMNCYAITWRGDYMAVATDEAIYTSNNGGVSWSVQPYAPRVEDFAWSLDGAVLFGIFPGESYSSGLWRSMSHGVNWEVVMYDVMMSSVHVDISGEVFVGYDTGGVGIMNLQLGQPTMINSGLPSLNVNNLTDFPLYDCPAVLACTSAGAFVVTDYSMGADDSTAPSIGKDMKVYPNPFNPETTIELDLPVSQNAEVRVFNARGEIVRTLDKSIGANSVVWNGRDSRGKAVGSGIYLFVAEIGGDRLVRKAVLMK